MPRLGRVRVDPQLQHLGARVVAGAVQPRLRLDDLAHIDFSGEDALAASEWPGDDLALRVDDHAAAVYAVGPVIAQRETGGDGIAVEVAACGDDEGLRLEGVVPQREVHDSG